MEKSNPASNKIAAEVSALLHLLLYAAPTCAVSTLGREHRLLPGAGGRTEEVHHPTARNRSPKATAWPGAYAPVRCPQAQGRDGVDTTGSIALGWGNSTTYDFKIFKLWPFVNTVSLCSEASPAAREHSPPLLCTARLLPAPACRRYRPQPRRRVLTWSEAVPDKHTSVHPESRPHGPLLLHRNPQPAQMGQCCGGNTNQMEMAIGSTIERWLCSINFQQPIPRP